MNRRIGEWEREKERGKIRSTATAGQGKVGTRGVLVMKRNPSGWAATFTPNYNGWIAHLGESRRILKNTSRVLEVVVDLRVAWWWW